MVWVGRGAGLRGDEAGAVGVELVAIEDGGGVAEDVVDAAFDVGVDVVLAAVVGEERVLMAEEAAVLEDAAVAAVGDGDGLAGVAGGVLEGDVVGLEAGAVDLDGLGEEGAAGGLGVERVGDDDVCGGFAEADEGDVGVVLGDDDALVIGAGGDLDEDAAGRAVGVGRGEGMVVERVLDGGEGGEVLVAGVGVRAEGSTRTWTSAAKGEAECRAARGRQRWRMRVSMRAMRLCGVGMDRCKAVRLEESARDGRLRACRVLRDVIPPTPPGPEGSNGNGLVWAQ